MNKLGMFLKQSNTSKILDVGTGNGNFIRIINSVTNDFSEIIGIDLLEVSIKGCKENFDDERINFFKMDAAKMEFDNDTFDLVCLSNSLHHLEDINVIMKEMERVLKPGGALIFCEMMSNNLNKQQKSHLMLHHFAAEVDRERGSFHDLTFSNQKILEILKEESSLNIVDAWDLTYPKREKNSKEEIEWLFETIDRVKERVTDSERRKYYDKKADKIKKYMNKNGFDSATQLIVILK